MRPPRLGWFYLSSQHWFLPWEFMMWIGNCTFIWVSTTLWNVSRSRSHVCYLDLGSPTTGVIWTLMQASDYPVLQTVARKNWQCGPNYVIITSVFQNLQYWYNCIYFTMVINKCPQNSVPNHSDLNLLIYSYFFVCVSN